MLKKMVPRLIGFFYFFSLTLALASPKNDVIIFFDQSGSVNLYDSKTIAKAWLISFIKNFPKPYRVRFLGFDDRIHTHLEIMTGTDVNFSKLKNKIEEIETKGYTTDLERPFKYLTEIDSLDSVASILIISDGTPEVFDRKLDFLSWRIREDVRYKELSNRYNALRASGAEPGKIYDELGVAFQKQNILFIEDQIKRLKEVIGKKLILWDISGDSYYLKRWAKMFGSEYVPVLKKKEKTELSNLETSFKSMLKETSCILEEPLAKDHIEVTKVILLKVIEEEKVKQPKKVKAQKEKEDFKKAVAAEKEAALAKQLESKNAQILKDAEKYNIFFLNVFLTVLALLGVGLFIYLVIVLEKKLSGRMFRIDVQKALKTNLMKYAVHEILILIRRLIPEYLIQLIKNFHYDAIKLRTRIFKEKFSWLKKDRRFHPRVKVPAGTITVYWTNKDKSVGQGDVKNISIKSLFFDAKTTRVDAASIDKIVCNNQKLTFEVTGSKITDKRMTGNVVLLHKFRDNNKDWMKWIELISRIDK